MGKIGLFSMLGVVALVALAGLAALLAGKCTWEQYYAGLAATLTAFYTYVQTNRAASSGSSSSTEPVDPTSAATATEQSQKDA